MRTLFILLLSSLPALADVPTDAGLAGGLRHDLLNWAAMVPLTVLGLWAAMLGRPKMWVVPPVAALAILGGSMLAPVLLPVVPITLPETALVLALAGIAVAWLAVLWVQPPVLIAALLAGVYGGVLGLLHAGPLLFSVGYAGAALLYVLIGLGAGLGLRFFTSITAMRFTALGAVAFGVWTLSGTV
ncbi:hypothetical protein ACMU_01255 [Actibacterium mucosum KCTC 23349]|uniref:Hydrogenase n=1 Tax=Actibacterium mucosum KCTC 23349 TaxID=1454373 RepID=A0A037ZM20_9RHOB|nr:hypothetical protein [Actibacterium mucosum]KAJ57149.1 hypothetical protein ACMU_01255 [Actibacterium mucosum KCTC 23349]